MDATKAVIAVLEGEILTLLRAHKAGNGQMPKPIITLAVMREQIDSYERILKGLKNASPRN